MFTQPSVNQIASTYQGNPAPLAQKVDRDKKQNGGIPQDLRQLLALNDITQGRNAMGIQQALQTPTNMPTVAQDLQERARQALQARQVQAVQEMMRKNGQPNMVPPGTPRPPMQPQGLDSLETNVGEGYAEGGIIGFDGVHGSAVKDPKQKEKEERALAEQRESDRRDLLTIPAALLDVLQLPVAAGYNLVADTGSAIEGGLNRLGSAITGENINTQSDNQVGGKFRFSPTPFTDKLRQPTERQTKVADQERQSQTVAATDPATIRSQLNAADAMSRAQPGTPPPPRANTGTQTRVNAPSAPGIVSVLPPEQTAAYKKLTEMMNLDPEAQERLAQAKFKQQVGERDLSIYDKTAAELEARKQKLNAPKAGYDAMMEYLEQVALGGGRTSAESGSIGAARQRQLQKERLSQQDLLMDKILELGGKKAEAEYAQKEKMYQVGQERYKEVYKNAFDAAKSVNSSDDEAKRIAAQAVENEKNRQAQIRAAQIGAQDRDQLMGRAKALMAADPTKKMTLEEAMRRAALAAGATSVMSTESKDKAKGIQELLALNEKMPASLRQGNSSMAKENRRLYEIALAALENTYGPLTSGINTLPSAGGPTSSNVRSQADAIIAGGR